MFAANYKSLFAPRWSGYTPFAMSAHSVIPRLSSGAESVTSAPGNVFFSSPVKDRVRLTTYKGIESSTMASNPSSMSLEEFLDKHLAQLPEEYEPSYDYWRKKLLPDIKNHQGHEHTLYDPICKLLNAISRSVHSKSLWLSARAIH